MFWALVLESGKQYSTTVEKSFHLSKAALDVTSVRSDNDILTVVFHSDGNEHILCNLSKAHALQETLDLNFMAGSKVVFECKGKGVVHLTGYIVPEDEFSGMLGEDEEDLEDESESETEVKPVEDVSKKSLKKPQQAVVSPVKRKQEKQLAPDAKKLKQDSDSDSDDDDDDDDDDDEDDDDDSIPNGLMQGSDDSDDSEEDEDGDDLDEEDDDEEDDDDSDADMLDLEAEEVEDEEDSDDSDEDSDEDEIETPAKNKKGQNQKTPIKTPQKDSGQKQAKTPQTQGKGSKQENKTPKQDNKTPKQDNKTPKQENKTPNAKSDKKQPKTPLLNGSSVKPNEKNTPAKTPKTPAKTLEGGVSVEDIKVGDGPVAKPGKFINVYYTGRFKNNNKQFDASTQGPGFKFRLGRNEVIKGWDVGLNGMKVGGKRRIVCPPEMAYGKKGSPPVIPSNAALVFDVELRSVN
ncbi:46 kDa FK506-binding nuclear protein isoform X1 [Bemisia tabaci]|uniref:46 kDa FK506-binding nuclear protein isoform X1 n=1 Tax=Bemisia tabaci TaxID=7038 RepID=UPI003B27BFC6